MLRRLFFSIPKRAPAVTFNLEKRRQVSLVFRAAWNREPLLEEILGWWKRMEGEHYHYLIRIAGEIASEPKLGMRECDDASVLAFLSNAHATLLGRPLDQAGLSLWLPYAREGHYGLVLRGIVSSDEFLQRLQSGELSEKKKSPNENLQ